MSDGALSPGVRSGANLKDVAARAGVSVKTVSNVVNGYVHVSDATRQRVQAVLDELNYRPNLSARNLRMRRSGVIAFAVPEIDLPYFAELARLVIRAAEVHGWTVLIDQTDGLAEREELVLRGIRAQLIDGLILNPIALGAREIASRTDQTPMVLLGERIHDGLSDHVAIDNVAASRAATAHLLDLGRHRVAVIGNQEAPTSGTARLRLRGYHDALGAAGHPVRHELVMDVEVFSRAEGARVMGVLLDMDKPPDAVFCFNDQLALGALRTLADRGVRVPDDVAVVGFDDIEDGRYSTPSLTTVAPDKTQIAEVSVAYLASRLQTGGLAPRTAVTDFSLQVRESTVGRVAVSAVPAALRRTGRPRPART